MKKVKTTTTIGVSSVTGSRMKLFEVSKYQKSFSADIVLSGIF